MSQKTLKARVQMKADTAANWAIAGNAGFVPLIHEPIFFTDTKKLVLGDGTTNINNLTAFYEFATDEDVVNAWKGVN